MYKDLKETTTKHTKKLTTTTKTVTRKSYIRIFTLTIYFHVYRYIKTIYNSLKGGLRCEDDHEYKGDHIVFLCKRFKNL